MPFTKLRPDPGEEPQAAPLPQTPAVIPLSQVPSSLQPRPAPQKLGAIAENALVADYRFPTIWQSIMERSYKEATDTLTRTLTTDFKLDPTDTGAVVLSTPCLVDVSEGRTQREKASILRVQKRLAKIFAGLIDRLFRYTGEYRKDAVDWYKQELLNWGPFIKPYKCEIFRVAEETEPKKKGKKKT